MTGSPLTLEALSWGCGVPAKKRFVAGLQPGPLPGDTEILARLLVILPSWFPASWVPPAWGCGPAVGRAWGGSWLARAPGLSLRKEVAMNPS